MLIKRTWMISRWNTKDMNYWLYVHKEQVHGRSGTTVMSTTQVQVQNLIFEIVSLRIECVSFSDNNKNTN